MQLLQRRRQDFDFSSKCAQKSSLRHRVLLGIERGLWYTGAAKAYNCFRQPHNVTILMYHSVAPENHAPFIAYRNRMSPELFRRQMLFLANHRHVLAIDELETTICHRKPTPAGSVVLTFDDGYLDNLTTVAPILEEFDLPATIYLATGYIKRSENQWADRLYTALRYRSKSLIDMRKLSDETTGLTYDLSDPSKLVNAYQELVTLLLVAGAEQRSAMLCAVFEQLQPTIKEPRLTLNWDEVNDLRKRYPRFTLGIHTDEHIDLTSISVHNARTHVDKSMYDFKHELGNPARHFSFPYSRSNPELCAMLADLELTTAMTGLGVADVHEDNLLNLPRLEAPDDLALLAYWTSGAHPSLTRTILRRG